MEHLPTGATGQLRPSSSERAKSGRPGTQTQAGTSMSKAWSLIASWSMFSMALSHSALVTKLPRGTVPHGTAYIRSSVGHVTRHEHSAEAVAAEVSRENATSTLVSRINGCPPLGEDSIPLTCGRA